MVHPASSTSDEAISPRARMVSAPRPREDVHAPVLLPAVLGLRVADRGVLTERERAKAAGLDAALDQRVTHGLDAAIAELLVVVVGPALVGVAVQHELDVRVVLRGRDDRVDLRGLRRADVRLVEIEQDALEPLNLRSSPWRAGRTSGSGRTRRTGITWRAGRASGSGRAGRTGGSGRARRTGDHQERIGLPGMAVLIGGTSREKHHEQHELYQECHRDLLFAAFE